MDSVILHEIAISLLSLSLPTHAYRLEISPRWQWPDLASIRPFHLSIVALRLNRMYSRCANCQTIARHAPREYWENPMTAGALARWILWDKETLPSSIEDYTRRFGLAAV